MDKEKLAPIIKKIKKISHGGHGAVWKIAYADFVTAMMAFFLLLWLLSSQPKERLEALADFFTPTIGITQNTGIGLDSGVGTDESGKGKKAASKSITFLTPASAPKRDDNYDKMQQQNESDRKNFENVQNQINDALEQNSDIKDLKDNISMEETPEGFKINFYDSDKRSMFVPGTAELQDFAKKILQVTARFIRHMPNYLAISAHTNSIIIPGVDNWELSGKRSYVIRKFLVDSNNIDSAQTFRLEAKADQEPLETKDLKSLKNNRLSLMLLKTSIMPYTKLATPENNGILDQNTENN